MNIFKKTYTLIHLAAWILLTLLPLLFPNARHSLGIEGFIIWILNAILNASIFYFFYGFLNRQFLKQKTIWLFILLGVASVLLFGSFRYLFVKGFIYLLQLNHQIKPFLIYLFGASFINSFFAALAIFVNFTEAWFRSQKLRQEIENERLQSELKMLRFQVNPHFLFNTLNNIYTLVYKKADTAPEAVLKLSNLMRYMLYESDSENVLLEKELNYITNFIELQKLRLAQHHKVHFSILGESNRHRIAPLLLIPFIENAFKHSAKAIDNSEVNIKIHINHQCLEFICINDYKPNQQTKVHSGVGLQNAKKRLQLLYPDNHTLEINATNNKFSVYLQLNW